MTIAPDSTAVEKTGKPTPPWVPPRIAVPRAYCVFEPATPYLKTLAISCQPTLLFGVVPLTHGPGIERDVLRMRHTRSKRGDQDDEYTCCEDPTHNSPASAWRRNSPP